MDIREGALSHGRGVNDTLQFLVEANRVGVHVLVGAAGDLDLIIDCAQFEDQSYTPRSPGEAQTYRSRCRACGSTHGATVQRASCSTVRRRWSVARARPTSHSGTGRCRRPSCMDRMQPDLESSCLSPRRTDGMTERTHRGRHSLGRSTTSSPSKPSPICRSR